MGRTDRKQRPASPGIDLAGKKPASAGAVLALTASTLAALWAAALLTGPGRVAYTYAFFFLEFFGGVFTLVGLTLTVMIGLLATDRLVLQPRQRVWIQSAHRTLGILSVSFLVIHILTKISEGRASALGTAVPFLGTGIAGQSALYVGLGPVAGYLMVGVLWTGMVRRRFAGAGRPWMWRTLHSAAYVSWLVALVHGLGAGRPPATWVTLSYLACLLAVAVALLLRLSTGSGRRTQAGRLATTTMSTGTGSMRPVGRLAPAVERRRTAQPRTAGRERRPGYEDTQFVAERLEPRELMDPVPVPVAERMGRSERMQRTERPELEPGPTGGRRRGDEEPVLAPARSRSARHLDDGRHGQASPAQPELPTRRRRRAADEYLVAPGRTGPDDHSRTDVGYGSAASYGPPPSRRAEQRRTEQHRAEERASRDEPRYRATAPAPPYIPAPDPVDDLVPDLDPLPPDDTPTLVDLASRRAMRDAVREREAAREAATKSRRSRRRKTSDKDEVDEEYWGYLRGEAR